MCQLILLGQMLDLVKYSTLEHIKKLPPSLGKQSWLQTTVSSSPWVHAEVLGEHHLGLQMSYHSFGQLGSPTDTSGGGGSGSSGDSSREEDCSGMPKIFHVECRGKKSHELFSRGFVLLRVLFLERGPLETRQPMARLLAAAVIEKGLLFVFKPFEVATCILVSCPALWWFSFQPVRVWFLFFFLICLKLLHIGRLFLMCCLVLLFSHTSFLWCCPRSTFNRWYIHYMLLLRFKSPNQLFNSSSR